MSTRASIVLPVSRVPRERPRARRSPRSPRSRPTRQRLPASTCRLVSCSTMPPRRSCSPTVERCPPDCKKLFAGSFFASVPGDNAAWVLLGLLEASVVVLLAVSLLRGEFLPQRRQADPACGPRGFSARLWRDGRRQRHGREQRDRDRAVHLLRRNCCGDVPHQADVAVPAHELAGGRRRGIGRQRGVTPMTAGPPVTSLKDQDVC